MADRYVVGKPVVIDLPVAVGGVATDPTAMVLIVTAPDGSTVSTYNWPTPATITRNGLGDFEKTFTLTTQAGVYSFVCTTTGTAADVQDGTFTVFDDVPLNTLYAQLDELKQEKGIGDSIDDSVLQVALGAASRQIDGACGWRFYQDATAVARYFHPTSAGTLDVTEIPGGQGISTSTGLLVALDADDTGTWESSLTIATDFNLGPLNADADGWPWTQIDLTRVNYQFNRSSYGRPTVKITAKWGWPTIPADIHKACLIQASQLANANKAVFGVAPVVAIDGAGMRAQAWNPLARALIAPYVRPAVG